MAGISEEAVNEVARNLFDGGDIDYTIERDGSAKIDTWNLPDVDNYEYSYGTVAKETLDKAIELLTKLISSVKFYVGDNGASLELNDNHTLWDINAPDEYEGEFDYDYYQYLVDQALDDFEERTGVEAHQDGRMGRHIVVDITFDNMTRFDELKAIQEELEADVIEKAEAECFPVVDGMTESLNKGEKKARCLSCGADVIYTNRDVCHDIDGDYIECPNCNATFDVDYDAITSYNRSVKTESLRQDTVDAIDLAINEIDNGFSDDPDWSAERYPTYDKLVQGVLDLIGANIKYGSGVEKEPTSAVNFSGKEAIINEIKRQLANWGYTEDYFADKKIKTESYEVWQKYFEDGEIARPEYVQSFDTFEEAQKFADGLNEDPDCEAWVKDLEESKKVTEAEDMSKVKDDVKSAVEKSDSTEQEKDQVKGSIDVLKTDEESAIDGYEEFNKETAKVVDKELSDEIDNQMQEIVDDEKEHIEKLDTIKSALGESKEAPRLTGDETYVARNSSGYKSIGLIIDNTNKQFQIINGQVMTTDSKTKKMSKKQIRDKAQQLYDNGYTEYDGYGSVAQGVNKKEELFNNSINLNVDAGDIASGNNLDLGGLGALAGLMASEETKKSDDKLEEATAGDVIRENLNTGVLRIIDVDMYSLNDEIPESATQEGLDEIIQDIAPKYLKEVIQEVLPSVEIYATGVYHPRQYNFSGDELEFDLVANKEEYEALKEKVTSDENFNAYLRNNYKSYDGFISYMADDISEFETQDTWKQVVQVIMFALGDEDNFGPIRNEYLDEFLDRVHTEFGWDDEDDDLEENKKEELFDNTADINVNANDIGSNNNLDLGGLGDLLGMTEAKAIEMKKTENKEEVNA